MTTLLVGAVCLLLGGALTIIGAVKVTEEKHAAVKALAAAATTPVDNATTAAASASTEALIEKMQATAPGLSMFRFSTGEWNASVRLYRDGSDRDISVRAPTHAKAVAALAELVLKK